MEGASMNNIFHNSKLTCTTRWLHTVTYSGMSNVLCHLLILINK